MTVTPYQERDDYFIPSPTGSVLDVPMAQENQNQLTVSTIISLGPDFANLNHTKESSKDSEKGNEVDKVESLYNVKSVEPTDKDKTDNHDSEKWYAVTLQVFIPFMIAGIGTIGAGIVLGNVENYKVFKEIKALYVLVPSIIGLKGNLDMCLASRLSTQANLGNMNSKREMFKMIVGNIGLVQVQAIVAANVVALFAVSVSALVNGDFDWEDALLLAAAGVLTATLSCFILDLVLICVILTSRKLNINPDNVATPFAASIGDVVSLLVLSTWARLLYEIHEEYPYVLGTILGVHIVIILPLWILLVRRNKYTSKILTHGWTPVLVALVISGTGGIVLDSAVDKFRGFVVFQPIINGIGGNLVSVQSSRISTMLHKTSLKGVIPPHTKQWVAPWTALISGVLSAKTARILILMSIPGQAIFVFAADLIYNQGTVCVHVPFVLSYLSVGVIQIMILLYIAHLMTHTMWKFKMDPDDSAIPYLTALGDLIGSSLLLLAFIFLRKINFDYVPIADD